MFENIILVLFQVLVWKNNTEHYFQHFFSIKSIKIYIKYYLIFYILAILKSVYMLMVTGDLFILIIGLAYTNSQKKFESWLLKTETVTTGADATVYVLFFGTYIWLRNQTYTVASAPFFCGYYEYLWNSVVCRLLKTGKSTALSK